MAIDFTLAPEHEEIRTRVRAFIEDTVKPRIEGFDDENRVASRREYLTTILELREEAKRAGLWLPHMPVEWGGMGLGDVKMMLMAGAFLGAKRTLLTILAGSLLGSVLGVAIILARRKDADYELPFGTFLGAGALLVVFFGTPLVNWYQSLLMVR